MLNHLKEIKRKHDHLKQIKNEYLHDCDEYQNWEYHNPDLHTQNSLGAKIFRQTHVLEKGMSVGKPKEKFGVQKAMELMDMIKEYEGYGYKVEESSAVLNALGVLNSYLKFHAERGYVPDKLEARFEPYRKYIVDDDTYGIHVIRLDELKKQAHGEFPEFIASRHSVRQYDSRNIDTHDVEKAVALAMHAPSACNRQSCKVYFYTDVETNEELGNLIAGNTGFDHDVKNYLIVTSDLSAFYDAFERNQVYVDGGIFTMALIEALHYYGIASCVLQNGEFKERNAEFKRICVNIPENEKIILFIAIGYYKEEFTYAASHRKKLDEVLITK